MNFLYQLFVLVNCTKRSNKESINDLNVTSCTKLLDNLITMAEQNEAKKSTKSTQERLDDLKTVYKIEKQPDKDLISSVDKFLKPNDALWKYLKQHDWKSMNKLFRYKIVKLMKMTEGSNESMFELVREKIKNNSSILKILPELKSIYLISIYDLLGGKIYSLYDSLAKILHLLKYYEVCTKDHGEITVDEKEDLYWFINNIVKILLSRNEGSEEFFTNNLEYYKLKCLNKKLKQDNYDSKYCLYRNGVFFFLLFVEDNWKRSLLTSNQEDSSQKLDDLFAMVEYFGDIILKIN